MHQAFSLVAIRDGEEMKRFLQVLEGTGSDKKGRHDVGLGKWTRTLLWLDRFELIPLFKPRPPRSTSNALKEILRLLPNLVAFSTNADPFPPDVFRTLLELPIHHTLQHFSVQGPIVFRGHDLDFFFEDFAKFIVGAKALKSLHLGWSNGHRTIASPIALPGLQNMHLKSCWLDYGGLEGFTSGSFPCLQSLIISDLGTKIHIESMNAFLATNGSSLKFLSLEFGPPYVTHGYDMTNLPNYCPALEYLNFDTGCTGLGTLRFLKSLRGVGIHCIRCRLPYFDTTAICLLFPVTILSLELPDTVETVNLYGLERFTNHPGDKVPIQNIHKWVDRCRDRGILVEDGRGNPIQLPKPDL